MPVDLTDDATPLCKGREIAGQDDFHWLFWATTFSGSKEDFYSEARGQKCHYYEWVYGFYTSAIFCPCL
jgi:hypothetical protein